MPKKGGKGKKGKKGAKKGEGEEGVELTPEEREAKAKLRIEALERELVQRTDVMNRSMQAYNEMRQRQAELLADFEREKQDTLSITADMTRQYKSMQEELLRRINALENTIQEQKDQLDYARQQNEEIRRQKDQELAVKDAQIADLKQKMEDMALEFGEMLKETLDKMSERIEATSHDWDHDSSGDLQKKLEELALGPGAK
mmetsp:Transcript_72667/g.194221  ORF Transcript_72667/g.194221 Transcript_72667/m.194221 type:complete len:201 (+) Transcript_72667:15-617(+)